MSSKYTSRQILYFAIPFVWMSCIFYFSTDVLSSKHTEYFTEPYLFKIFPFIHIETIHIIHFIIRKLGHITEYAILSTLWTVAFLKSQRRGLKKIIIIAAFLSIGYAMLDEWHQTFTTERSGKISDVVIDAVGVLVGLILTTIYIKIRRKNNQRKREVL